MSTRSQGWGRLLNGNRTIWVVSAIAVVALAAGLVLGRFVVSPADAANNATAPEPGLITVPVEKKVLGNDITIRGDATYADSVEVTIETGDLGGPAIVTGQVPEVGATLDAVSIALEVAGRPVIVLPGDLPVYRTLRLGVAGPDVVQLKQGLEAVGIEAGDVTSNLFDADTSAGVQALYERVGYPAPDAPEGVTEAVQSATEQVRSAEDGVALAEQALSAAQSGPSAVDRVEQDNLVRAGERALAAARAAGEPNAIADATDALTLAKTRRDSAFAARDVTAEAAALRSAEQQATSARDSLTTAEEATMTYLPAGEILYLPGLPRRVDEVTVDRGSTIKGSVMRVSGATIQISATASAGDAKLMKVGDAAVLSLPDDSEHGATVTSIAVAESAEGTEAASGRFTILLTPDELTPEQLQSIQGSNLRVTIPVSSTDGEVLAVPLAALTAGPGGESRVEVSSGTGDETVLVEVTAGLAADGFVEVVAVDGSLGEGDLVVVGR
ncbi:hypothetical protein E3T49_07060 [Cryobacterium cryoconiti]|uniref:Peptidoglycan binding-like domain-containing protein n=1 Tax=Cryobacterium cryoconiti TaxID=1259239 RepID=A0A4Y8JW69_9MICO|nr:hypothetical protein E3T49_07060 [Cryobacterium cryoconiti]